MAIECLVRKFDGTGDRKAGEIISVKESPAVWGSDEGPPNYIIVLVNGTTVEDFAEYNQRHVGTGVYDSDGNEITVRSKYRYNFAILPNFSEVTAKVVVNINQAIPTLINRIDEFKASL